MNRELIIILIGLRKWNQRVNIGCNPKSKQNLSLCSSLPILYEEIRCINCPLCTTLTGSHPHIYVDLIAKLMEVYE